MQFDKDSTGADRCVWTGYVQQDADNLVQASQARSLETGHGTVVAIIDTGIDPDHPLLSPHLVPGYDFLLDQAGGRARSANARPPRAGGHVQHPRPARSVN